MKAVVTRADQFLLLNPERRVRGQTARFRIEPELRDEIGARDILRRFENIVLHPRDVRDEGKTVRRIGRDRVRPNGGLLAIDQRRPDSAVRPERVHRRIPALVIRR